MLHIYIYGLLEIYIFGKILVYFMTPQTFRMTVENVEKYKVREKLEQSFYHLLSAQLNSQFHFV